MELVKSAIACDATLNQKYFHSVLVQFPTEVIACADATYHLFIGFDDHTWIVVCRSDVLQCGKRKWNINDPAAHVTMADDIIRHCCRLDIWKRDRPKFDE